MEWLQSSADALVGALIGGGLSGLAVWLSMRAQRRGADEEAAVVAVVRLQGACGHLALLANAKRLQESEARTAISDLMSASMDARARLYVRWPRHADQLAQDMERLTEATQSRQRAVPKLVESACHSVISTCREWLEARPRPGLGVVRSRRSRP